jgi:phosphoglucosamine mutase
VAGFTTVGMDVILAGPMPTPAVAILTRSLHADLRVMISASHNPFADNGIKLFGPDGYKRSDETEATVETLQGLRLDGRKVVIDCANGAAYKVTPAVRWELRADVRAGATVRDAVTGARDGGSRTRP